MYNVILDSNTSENNAIILCSYFENKSFYIHPFVICQGKPFSFVREFICEGSFLFVRDRINSYQSMSYSPELYSALGNSLPCKRVTRSYHDLKIIHIVLRSSEIIILPTICITEHPLFIY